ncbi:hypothetical protein FRC08_016388 [Ceratobasidium sp. 394]|nr:hypothetical protein FRC08_016388 [Ceratobasidium sp. 394]
MSFFTLKYGEGQTQLLLRSPKSVLPELSHRLEDVPVESVVLVEGPGTVVARPGSANEREVEIHVDKYTTLDPAIKLPFQNDERFELISIKWVASTVGMDGANMGTSYHEICGQRNSSPHNLHIQM